MAIQYQGIIPEKKHVHASNTEWYIRLYLYIYMYLHNKDKETRNLRSLPMKGVGERKDNGRIQYDYVLIFKKKSLISKTSLS